MKNKDHIKLKIYYRDYFILIFGAMKEIPSHAHHAIQIFIDLEGGLKIRSGGKDLSGSQILINSDVPHQVSASPGDHLTLLIDSDSQAAYDLSAGALNGIPYKIKKESFGLNHSMLDDPGMLINKILESWGIIPTAETSLLDERIERARKIISARDEKKISIADLSGLIHLSESRLAHLFKEQMGIPLRKYLLWRRLMDALYLILEGSNLTEAAYNSGFSDSAHLSRTFKENFGINLSHIFKNSRFIQFFSL